MWTKLFFQFLATGIRLGGEVAMGSRNAEQALKDLVEHGFQIVTDTSDKTADDARAHLPDEPQPEAD